MCDYKDVANARSTKEQQAGLVTSKQLLLTPVLRLQPTPTGMIEPTERRGLNVLPAGSLPVGCSNPCRGCARAYT